MCWRVREGEYPPPPPLAPRGTWRERYVSPVVLYVRECYLHPYYVWVFFAIMLGGLAGVPINTYGIPFARSLGLTDADYGKLLVATYAVSLVLTFILGWLADRFHPLRLALVTLGLYGVAMIGGATLAVDGRGFSIVFVAHGILMGAYLTGVSSLGARLFPKAKFAQFGSAAGLIGAFSLMALAPGVGLWLDHTGQVYRHTFVISGALALSALAAFVVVYRRYQALGGDAAYRPPE
jgi:MFS family permease